MAVPWLTGSPPPPFNQGVSCRGLPRDHAAFLQKEIERLTLSGVLRPVEYSRWVSRAFLIPKSAGTGWRLIVDLKEINKACHTRKMKMETLRSLRLIAQPGDHWVSFDLKDGFYSLAIAPQDREAFTVNLDGKLLQFCALPMGWSLIPFVFQKLKEVFTNHLQDPESSTSSPGGQQALGPKALKPWRRRRRRLTRARLLPFVDDFALFDTSFDKTLKLKDYTFVLLTGPGLKINSTKGHFIPILIGEHLGMIIDMKEGQFVAPTAKLKQIAELAKTLLCRAAAHKRWANVKTLASLAGKAQFLHMAIPVARFFLRELHDVVNAAKCWAGTVRVTP